MFVLCNLSKSVSCQTIWGTSKYDDKDKKAYIMWVNQESLKLENLTTDRIILNSFFRNHTDIIHGIRPVSAETK